MPGLLLPPPVTAAIMFDVPESRLGHSKSIYETYVVDRPAPTERLVVPLVDLRREQEGAGWAPALKQLEQRGFAAVNHESFQIGPALDTSEGVEAYLLETAEFLKSELGASKVLSWNSVIRRNDPSSIVPRVEARQLAPERNAMPSKSIKVIASAAHIDQDEEYGRVICKRAAGEDVFERFSRVQIINLWRPLKGPVTNAPLAVCDSRSLDRAADLSIHASVYGTGYGISYSTGQRWGFISRQQPHEALVLKCYDSFQGKEGVSMFAPHVACSEVFGEPEVDEVQEPRVSIEARMVVLHE